MKRGLLLIDRGSREKDVQHELHSICEKIKQKKKYEFSKYCFLEVVPPYIDEMMINCLSHNIDELIVIPYFLYYGRKIRAAIKNAIRFQSTTNTKIIISRSMSMHKHIIRLVEDKITDALLKNNIINPNMEIDILLICHGSKEPNSQFSIKYVINELQSKYNKVKCCFLEIEHPNIQEGVINCIKNNPKVLVIVLYFLHNGSHVKNDITTELDYVIRKSNFKDIIITEHIGANEKLIDLIMTRALQAENANKKGSVDRK